MSHRFSSKLEPDSRFEAVIEQAYQVFRYPVPAQTGVCEGCCMEPEIEADFFNPPIRELPLEYLRDWFFAACEPPLPKSVWGYLLPRVMEVLASGQDPASVGLEVSLARFPTGDRAQWSNEEWQVLDRFQREYLDWYVECCDECLDDALCMFHCGGWDLSVLLAQMEELSDARLLDRLHRDWMPERGGNIWITAFWERGGSEAAYAWYTSRALYDRAADCGLSPETPPALADRALAVADLIYANADWAVRV